MSDAMNPPFKLGDEMWLPQSQPHEVQIPCPVCNGDRRVTVILGDGEHVSVQCDGCGLGYDGPRGYIKEYQYTPGAERVIIRGVESYRGGQWYVRLSIGHNCYSTELVATKAEALAESERRGRVAHEDYMLSHMRVRGRSARKATWDVRSHRERIADCQRQIAWHEARVSSGNVTKPKKAKAGPADAAKEIA